MHLLELLGEPGMLRADAKQKATRRMLRSCHLDEAAIFWGSFVGLLGVFLENEAIEANSSWQPAFILAGLGLNESLGFRLGKMDA